LYLQWTPPAKAAVHVTILHENSTTTNEISPQAHALSKVLIACV